MNTSPNVRKPVTIESAVTAAILVIGGSVISAGVVLLVTAMR